MSVSQTLLLIFPFLHDVITRRVPHISMLTYVVERFFEILDPVGLIRVVAEAMDSKLVSNDHFTVDGTLVRSWASQKSIKAIDDGTVILAAYTAETGYIIQIQHDNDLLSVYKHNSSLLKKEGDKVRAGEAVAVIGETGEFSTGPHLHFEMWRNGVPLNPETFFSFE